MRQILPVLLSALLVFSLVPNFSLAGEIEDEILQTGEQTPDSSGTGGPDAEGSEPSEDSAAGEGEEDLSDDPVQPFTVTFELGKNAADAAVAPGKQEIAADAPVQQPTSDPEPAEGYEFAGWYLKDADGAIAETPFAFETIVIESDITLVAEFVEQELITFDAGIYTATFYVPNGSGGWEGTQKDTEEDNTVLPLVLSKTPVGFNSFLGWTTEVDWGTASLPPDDSPLYNFGTPLEKDTDFYPVFSNKWLVQFLNNDDQVYLSKLVEGDQPVDKPTDDELVGFTYPLNREFHNDWTIEDGDGSPYDFSTPVTANITLKPIISIMPTIYFITNGSVITPQPVPKGTRLDDTNVITLPTPIRTGFVPDSPVWTTHADGTIDPDLLTTPVNADIYLYARWVPTTVSYKIVYWVEKPNLGVDYIPDPVNSPFEYDYVGVATGYAFAGTLVTVTDIPPSLRDDKDEALRYAVIQPSSATEIAGDGSTIINVYAQLRVYTYEFNLGADDRTLTIPKDGGTTYNNTDKRYKIPIKFGQDVTDTWPTPDTAIFSFTYEGWNSTGNWNLNRIGTGDQVTRINSMAGDYMPNSSRLTGSGITINPGTTASDHYTVQYWVRLGNLESAPIGAITRLFNQGSILAQYRGTYYLLDGYKQTDSYNPLEGKQIQGLEYRARVTSTSERTTDFLYERKMHSFIYDLKGYGNPILTRSISYDREISTVTPSLNVTPVYSGSDREFVGWYKDADCIHLYDFTGRMPDKDVTIYAKWEPTALYVHFRDTDGVSFLPGDDVPGGFRQGIENPGKVANINNLLIGGNTYDSNLNLPDKGAFDGWEYEPWENGARIPFAPDTMLDETTYLYARWKTTNLILQYHDTNGDPLLTDKGPGGNGYDLNSRANPAKLDDLDQVPTDPKDGREFYGWRIQGDSSGHIYSKDGIGSILVYGNLHLYPFWGTLGDTLIKVTYHRNVFLGDIMTAESTEVKDQPFYTLTLLQSGFERPGYTLVGWNTASDGNGDAYALGAEHPAASTDVELYAQWTAVPYTVTYSYTNDPVPAGAPDVPEPLINQYVGSTITVDTPDPSLAGYTFSGWTASTPTDVTIENGEFVMPDSNVNITGTWNA
jgi:uncharacterized repeat protein (TIGR02543 family)